jgi:hypothetical protein
MATSRNHPLVKHVPPIAKLAPPPPHAPYAILTSMLLVAHAHHAMLSAHQDNAHLLPLGVLHVMLATSRHLVLAKHVPQIAKSAPPPPHAQHVILTSM